MTRHLATRRLGFTVKRCAALVARLDASDLGTSREADEAQRWLSAALAACTAAGMTDATIDDYAFPGFDQGRANHCTAVQVDNQSTTDCAK